MSFTPANMESFSSIATAGMQIASPFMGAKAQRDQGLDMQAAFNYNAVLADLQAEEAATAGRVAQEQLDRSERSLLSTQQAQYAKAGVMLTGSALDTMLRSATEFEFDRGIEKYNTQIAVQRYRSQAAVQRYYGEVSRYTATVGSQTSLISGIPKIAEGVGTIANVLAKRSPYGVKKSTVDYKYGSQL